MNKFLYGSVDQMTGKWYPNPSSDISEAQQLNLNVQNGFLCKCGFLKRKCRCKKGPL